MSNNWPWCGKDGSVELIHNICKFLHYYGYSSATNIINTIFIDPNQRQYNSKEIQNKSEGIESLHKTLKDVVKDQRLISRIQSRNFDILIGHYGNKDEKKKGKNILVCGRNDAGEYFCYHERYQRGLLLQLRRWR